MPATAPQSPPSSPPPPSPLLHPTPPRDSTPHPPSTRPNSLAASSVSDSAPGPSRRIHGGLQQALPRPSSSASEVSGSSTSTNPPGQPADPQLLSKQHTKMYNMRLYGDERPPSPLTLTSSLAPPSLMPTTASAIPAKPIASPQTPGSSRRAPAANLKLSMLPSAPPTSASSSPHSSTALYYASSTSQPNGSHASSPGFYSHQNYASSLSTQQRLQLHQKEFINQATRATGIPAHLLSTGPMSPRLIPLGSPGGPVTPLILEQEKDSNYFVGSELGETAMRYACVQRT